LGGLGNQGEQRSRKAGGVSDGRLSRRGAGFGEGRWRGRELGGGAVENFGAAAREEN